MIPKRIFFYWGNKTMSWMRYMTIKSFRILNPTWDITLYCSNCSVNTRTWESAETQDYFSFDGVDYMKHVGELGINVVAWDFTMGKTKDAMELSNVSASHSSNIFKWYMLATEGGIYSDMDILYFRPIDNFYNIIKNHNAAICQGKYLSIGLLASSGNNEFFEDIYINSFSRYTPTEYQSAGVLCVYNLYDKIARDKYPDKQLSIPNYDILQIAQKEYPDMMFYNIPMSLIYAYDSSMVDEAFSATHGISGFPQEAIGYHWYGGHPKAQEYNNTLTENNYKDKNIMFTNIVREICGI